MRNLLIADEPLSDLLPYGKMVDDQTILLHDAPALSPNGVPLNFAFGCMWRIRQLNVDAMSWGGINDILTALVPPLRDLPKEAIVEARMTLSPKQSDEEWLQARPESDRASHRQHIESAQVHHINGRECRSTEVTAHISLRVPVNLKGSVGWFTGYDTIVGAVEAVRAEQLVLFEERALLLEKQLVLMGISPARLTGLEIVHQVRLALNPNAPPTSVFDPDTDLATSVAVEPCTLSPTGFETPEWAASVYSLHKPPSQTYPGMLSSARTPMDTTIGVNLWELSFDHPITLVTQLALENPAKVKRHIAMQRFVAGFLRRSSSGTESTEIAAVANSLDEFAAALQSNQDFAVLMSTNIILWRKSGATQLGATSLRYALQRVGLEFLAETLEGNVMFLRSLPLGNSMTCPNENLLRRMRTMPLTNALHLMPILGSFDGYGARTNGIRLLNERGEPVHYDPIKDNHRPHGVIVGSNRSGKSAYANWLAYCLVPQGATFIFLDRHGSYRSLCDVIGGRHIRFAREDPICLGPFDGDLGPDHQDSLLTIMAEMATRVNPVIPQASTTLTNKQGLVLAQELKHWAESGDVSSVPTLGQFVNHLAANRGHDEATFDELTAMLSPYCNDGPFSAFIDGPAELRIEPGLLSMDVEPLVNAGQLGSVVTATLIGWIDTFVKNPSHLATSKFVVMDEVSFDLKSPQAIALIERMTRAYARYNAALWLISQNMADFKGEIGEIIRNNAGAFISFALNPDEADRFCETFTPDAPHIAPLLKRLKPHTDCSQGFIFLPDGGGGAFRVVADPEFMLQIGQSAHHRALREEALAHAT